MIPALLSALLGALVFVEQDIDGLYLSAPIPPVGTPILGFRHADVDGDGLQDLILPQGIAFQREGTFPENARVALPKCSRGRCCDVWGRNLYLRHPGRLEVIRWEQDDWQTVAEQEVHWPPDEGELESLSSQPHEPELWFDRFLHDIDADDVPELVIPGTRGLHIFGLANGKYADQARLDVFPAAASVATPTQALWPSSARGVIIPARFMSCRLFLDGSLLTVVADAGKREDRIRYSSSVYEIAGRDESDWDLKNASTSFSEWLPQYMTPCQLNRDGIVDYAGAQEESGMGPIFSPRIYETCAVTDGGETYQRFRVLGFAPQRRFVDYDGDGDLDLVTESTGLFHGGLRECVERFLTGKVVRHGVQVHLQDAQGRFVTKPAMDASVEIRFGQPPFNQGAMFRHYCEGGLLDISGDINGDGWNDVVVQDRPNRVAVYLSDGRRIQSKPDAAIPIKWPWWFEVFDVNADGRSDIVLTRLERRAVPSRNPWVRRARIYFSHEETP